jgi:hypothetical protein
MICPLCANSVKEFHKRSHLIPEWMYTDCYDEGHKIIEVSRHDEKATRIQKGIYHSIICKACEKETQKYDHYASLVLTARSPMATELASVEKNYICEKYNGRNLEFAKWTGLDFRKFQNFVLSIILRTHFAWNRKDPILLTQKHFEGILNIYKGGQPDDTSYPIMLLEYPKSDKLRNLVVMPYVTRKMDHHVIEFAGGGYLFNVYVSSHEKPSYVRSLAVKNDGSAYVLIDPFINTGLFKGTVQIVKSVKTGPRNI